MTSPAEERRGRALELHLAGATYDQIAKQVGYASRSGAFKAVQDALKAQTPPNVDEAAGTELARLDAMLTGLWPKARRGDLGAVDRVLKIGERRQALLAELARAPEKGSTRDQLAEKRAARKRTAARKPGPSRTAST